MKLILALILLVVSNMATASVTYTATLVNCYMRQGPTGMPIWVGIYRPMYGYGRPVRLHFETYCPYSVELEMQ